MSNRADDTTNVRTLPPHQFPSEPIALDFDWRAELNDRAEAQVRQTVYDALRLAELDGVPAVAIVRRLGLSFADDTLNVDVYDGTGKRLCMLRIAENGFGNLSLMI
jgi:hypothetical protein